MLDVTQASIVLLGLSLLAAIALMAGGIAFALFVQRQYPPSIPEEEPVEDAALAKRSAAYRFGLLIFLGLAVLTIVEFIIGVTWPAVVMLLVIALIKAGLIVQNYMHASRVWSEEGHS
jgi:cytochrome c oxidase subunit 4